MIHNNNYTVLISFAICIVLLGNIVMIVNILRMTSIRSDVLVIKPKPVDHIRSIMSGDDHGGGHVEGAKTPHLSNATLPRLGYALVHPGSLEEAIELRLMLIRQRKIVNEHDYDYSIKPGNICTTGREVDLVLGVTAPADDFTARERYRSWMADNYSLSWSEKLKTVQLFFLGLPAESSLEDAQRSILAESKRFNDIVQGEYPDKPGGHNAKTMSLLQWVTRNCPGAKFVVKVSPECYMNIPMVLDELTKMRRKQYLFMMGHLASKDLMKSMEASPESAVPYSTYKLEYYPAFLNGGAVGYPMEVAALLYQTATRFPAFPLEEVFFTGICADFINIPRIDNPAMYFNSCYEL